MLPIHPTFANLKGFAVLHASQLSAEIVLTY